MGWLTPELNTVLLSALIAIVGAFATWIVAWLRLKTKELTEMAKHTNEVIAENTKLTKKIEQQTDGLNAKLIKIASAAGFTRGRVQGRVEGEGSAPYDDLEALEEEVRAILDSGPGKPLSQTIKGIKS